MRNEIKDMIDSVVSGSDASYTINENIKESFGNPFSVRSKIRQISSEFYNFLSESGCLHEFSLDLLDDDLNERPDSLEKYLIDKYEIPKEFKPVLRKIVNW